MYVRVRRSNTPIVMMLGRSFAGSGTIIAAANSFLKISVALLNGFPEIGQHATARQIDTPASGRPPSVCAAHRTQMTSDPFACWPVDRERSLRVTFTFVPPSGCRTFNG